MYTKAFCIHLGLVAVLAGCAATPDRLVTIHELPIRSVGAEASAVMADQMENTGIAAVPDNEHPAVIPPKQTTMPSHAQNFTNEHNGKVLLNRLLPQGIPDRNGWNNDIFTAFTHLKIPYTPQYFCAVLAVAEQESGFSPDPVTPNLSKIVWGEIEKRRQKYLIPAVVVNAAMLKTSPDGRSYKDRINSLRTKRQMNALYEDMARELPFGQTLVEQKNPIRDGGPMQVSVAFAETHIRAWPYPYAYRNLRDEVFTRRGSVYFGTAILLQYPAPYSDMVYRFADYNVGRYSSRNAAFQAALVHLVRHRLAIDGDLMLYQNKMARIPSGEPSETQKALSTLTGRLQMSQSDILRDLSKEKLSSFSQTLLYQKVFALADQVSGKHLPREVIPQIVLVSPKITHHLTTEWFARKVDGRYHRCLARIGS